MHISGMMVAIIAPNSTVDYGVTGGTIIDGRIVGGVSSKLSLDVVRILEMSTYLNPIVDTPRPDTGGVPGIPGVIRFGKMPGDVSKYFEEIPLNIGWNRFNLFLDVLGERTQLSSRKIKRIPYEIDGTDYIDTITLLT